MCIILKWHKISDEKRNKLDYSEIGVLDVKLPLPPEHRTLYSKTGDVLIKYILISGLIIVLLIDLLISNYFKKKYIQISAGIGMILSSEEILSKNSPDHYDR